MAKYIIWSINKAEGAVTYEELLAFEKSTGYSYSSEIVVDDIVAVMQAIYNETDHDLQYHRLDPKFFY